MSTSTGDAYKAAGRGYHHGNLRAALIDAATVILAEEGVTGLSLRGAARRAGVSQTAPYRHFRDKAALLAAVAAGGFGGLAQAMRRFADDGRSPQERLLGAGRGYLAFALQESALFRLMFGPEIPDKAAHPELRAAADEAFAVLLGAVSGQTRGAGSDAADRALAAWSLVHGLATLLIDGQVRATGIAGPDAADPERLIRRLGRFLSSP